MNKIKLIVAILICSVVTVSRSENYPIVDTNQRKFFNNTNEISKPKEGEAFYGQDAQYIKKAPSYTDNGDNTITDNVTGLIWQKSYNVMTYEKALEELDRVNNQNKYNDWRLPTIKELYSLIDFSGKDVSGFDMSKDRDRNDLIPFINTDYFDFEYGSNGERIIDTQLMSSTIYVGDTMEGLDGNSIFGLNVADGRIKGYGSKMKGKEKLFTVRFVRGNKSYGINKFVDNGNTITDRSTGLMWVKNDSGYTMNWKDGLAWAEKMNEINYLGYNDWRVPNAKELHSIVDYTRSPQTTNSPAINEMFNSTKVLIEDGREDYGFYWTSTTHENMKNGNYGVYIAFGEGAGFFNIRKDQEGKKLMDVHGAGSQRSDPKAGDPNRYPEGHGPQGDVIRINNLVRLVRDTK